MGFDGLGAETATAAAAGGYDKCMNVGDKQGVDNRKLLVFRALDFQKSFVHEGRHCLGLGSIDPEIHHAFATSYHIKNVGEENVETNQNGFHWRLERLGPQRLFCC